MGINVKTVLKRILASPKIEFAARIALAAKIRFGPRGGGKTADVDKRSSGEHRTERRSTDQLVQVLDTLEIFPGDCVMMHSSAGAIQSWGWDAKEFIDFLIQYLGDDGTLAMPTHPKLRKDKNGNGLVYNVRRSPSTVGTTTEIFRRYSGTLRSECPYSAAAAIGPQAEYLTSGHRDSFAPHDKLSPYGRLAEIDGKCLCVGADLTRMTILHVAEDILGDEWPIKDFHESQTILVRSGSQERSVVINRRRQWLWWYLSLERWSRQMFAQQLARSATLDDVTLYAADARPTVDWMVDQARQGNTIYPLAGYNRWLKLKDPPRAEGA